MKRSVFSICFFLSSFLVLAYSPEKAGFTIEVNGEKNPYKIFSFFVMPQAPLTISSQSTISISSETIPTIAKEEAFWKVVTPETPGMYSMIISSIDGENMLVNVLVLTPLSSKKGEYLNGYRVGNYPSQPLRGNPIYNKPKGLFEVTSENADLQLTPHFQLKQFVCKQAGGFPKYLIVRERLLLKLEHLLQKVNEQGYEIETFGFISGYRTPYYNKSIKNVQYSRHVYGGASDIFVDQNKDGSMDDLSGDGKIDEADVRVFYNIVTGEFDKPSYDKFKGGLGFYNKNSRHNGFIHVDVRGSKARW